jgi:hypothetical protein
MLLLPRVSRQTARRLGQKVFDTIAETSLKNVNPETVVPLGARVAQVDIAPCENEFWRVLVSTPSLGRLIGFVGVVVFRLDRGGNGQMGCLVGNCALELKGWICPVKKPAIVAPRGRRD